MAWRRAKSCPNIFKDFSRFTLQCLWQVSQSDDVVVVAVVAVAVAVAAGVVVVVLI